MRDEDLKLDGNAAGGILGEIFAWETTTATATCDSCGASGAMATLEVWMHAPGTVVRCPACGAVLLRVARGDGRVWLDARGVSCLELRAPG